LLPNPKDPHQSDSKETHFLVTNPAPVPLPGDASVIQAFTPDNVPVPIRRTGKATFTVTLSKTPTIFVTKGQRLIPQEAAEPAVPPGIRRPLSLQCAARRPLYDLAGGNPARSQHLPVQMAHQLRSGPRPGRDRSGAAALSGRAVWLVLTGNGLPQEGRGPV